MTRGIARVMYLVFFKICKGRTPYFEKKFWTYDSLFVVVDNTLSVAQNPATTLVSGRSSYKMFSPKKSFSTHFHIKYLISTLTT